MPSSFRRGRTFIDALNDVEEAIDEAVDNALQRASNDAAESLNAVVNSWKNKPEFRAQKDQLDKSASRYVVLAMGPDKTLSIWGYVDKGTEPHLIFPVKAKALKFRTGYSARTAPIARADVGTGQASGPITYRAGVAHPGNEPRDFAAYTALEAEQNLINYLLYNLRKI